MLVRFLIIWLLCAVAFAVDREPANPMSVIKTILCGVLIAIAICFVPPIALGG